MAFALPVNRPQAAGNRWMRTTAGNRTACQQATGRRRQVDAQRIFGGEDRLPRSKAQAPELTQGAPWLPAACSLLPAACSRSLQLQPVGC